MKKVKLIYLLLVVFCVQITAQNGYKNFKVSVYVTVNDVLKMKDTKWLESSWEKVSSNLHVDKLYLETYRDTKIIDEKTLKKVIKFFKNKGVELAGGITYTSKGTDNFATFCYSNPVERKKAKEIAELTARNFDELILDDFFFTSCKCKLCVDAKGNKSWTEYRLNLMTEAAKKLVIEPAKKANPNVKVVIKYPNWYDHFHECGFNLETQPQLFDGIYTGTETRDAALSDQHLQPYLGYCIFRYFENLKPGKNGGGWVDMYASKHFDRYAEQLWLTILAKAPEMTLFEYSAMNTPLPKRMIPSWKDVETSFDYNNFLPIKENQTMARAAGHALKQVDKIAGKLGNPIGIKSYKPFHSTGEDFLQNFIGMLGIPMEIVPELPMDDDMLFLTEQAKDDPKIVEKIEKRLYSGKDVMITSGLYKTLENRGIKNIVKMEISSRKADAKDFKIGRNLAKSDREITIPQMLYSTNDSWEIISALSNGNGWPLLHRGEYAEAYLYVLAIPDNFNDLYDLPAEVLNKLRQIICAPIGYRLIGPSMVSMFVYDNNTFVVESFKDEAVEVEVVFDKKNESLQNLANSEVSKVTVIPEKKFWGRVVAPEMYSYKIKLPPHSFKAFKIK